MNGFTESCILKIKSVKYNSNIDKPYLYEDGGVIYTTGVIIEFSRGIILTSYIAGINSIGITGTIAKLGDRIFDLEVLNVCPMRGICLLQVSKEDLSFVTRITSPYANYIKYYDNFRLQIGDQVICSGFTDNSDLSMTSCTLTSMFSALNSPKESLIHSMKLKKSSMYPTNVSTYMCSASNFIPGSIVSLNDTNNNVKIIGITLYEGHFVPIRTILTVIQYLGIFSGNVTPDRISPDRLPNKVIVTSNDMDIEDVKIPEVAINVSDNTLVEVPTLGFEWSNANYALMGYKCRSDKIYGIYVNWVSDNSCFTSLEVKDVITHICYDDIFIHNIDKNGFIDVQFKNKTEKLVCFSDRVGNFVIYKVNEEEGKTLKPNPSETDICISSIKFRLKQIEDQLAFTNISSGNEEESQKHTYNIQVQICRYNSWYMLDSKFINKSKIKYQNPDYEYFCGAIIIEGTIVGGALKQSLILSSIIPGSSMYKTNGLKEGVSINEINGKRIKSLSELRLMIDKLDTEFISIETEDCKFFMDYAKNLHENDNKIVKSVKQIKNHQFADMKIAV
ncbi:hypothetical protein D3C87_806380 [compost metagenome]